MYACIYIYIYTDKCKYCHKLSFPQCVFVNCVTPQPTNPVIFLALPIESVYTLKCIYIYNLIVL